MTTVLNPLISPFNNLPFNAHSDYVRFFFEAGIIGLLCYLVYSWRLCLWGLRCARAAMPVDAPQAFAAAAALLAFLFLSFGTTEVSLNTAVLYELYGVLALVATPNSQRLVWQGEVEILQRARPAADR
jgi:O-antigen ligase